MIDFRGYMAISIQMDAVELEFNDEEVVEAFPDQPGLASPNGIYDEPAVFPRIGKQYQVEIPLLRTGVELVVRKENQISIENALTDQCDFGTGMTVPIMWVCHESADVKVEQTKTPASSSVVQTGNVDWISIKENPADAKHIMMHEFPVGHSLYHDIHLQDFTCKVEPNLSHNSKLFEGLTCQGLNKVHETMDMIFPPEEPSKVKHYRPLPGSPSISWSDDEAQSFLLGLYIYGKHLIQVRDFIECKSMGNILAFYYGKFYRSDAYRKWSESRKIKSRKCILGPRIFTGWRQQELLSRVLPTVAKDVQDTLLEATKMFNESKTYFEEYMDILKAKIGVKALVDAVAVGKGKHDLTVLDLNRTNRMIPIPPEIPIGKACSSLSYSDIIKFLTGDFRLSKARSNDLFWEAVWPRLLARGWHSEQLKDTSVISKNSLVFVIPGIKKFSRKKLVKGNHYFDSVSDVLNKVASDPRILELEGEGSKGDSPNKDENGWPIEQNGLPNRQHQCYLQPRVPNCNSELMKFTIVDTSMVLGEGPFKVRELRGLPLDVTSAYISLQNTRESRSDSSEQDSDDFEGKGTAPRSFDDTELERNSVCKMDGVPLSVIPSAVGIVSSMSSQINGHMCNDQFSDQVSSRALVKDVHCHFSDRSKQDEQVSSTPVTTKRRRLAACKSQVSSHRASPSSRDHQQKKVGTRGSVTMTYDDIVVDPDTSLGNIRQNYSTNSSSDEKTIFIPVKDCHNSTSIQEPTFDSERPQSRTLIDLNLLPQGSLEYETLHVPPEYEVGEHLRSEVVGSQHNANSEEAVMLPEGIQHEDGADSFEIYAGFPSDQQVSGNSRRQSTRNRPPTARALEALACGFIGTKRRGRENLVNRPSRRFRKTVETPPSFPSSNVATDNNSFEVSYPLSDENPQHASALNDSVAQSDNKMIHEFISLP